MAIHSKGKHAAKKATIKRKPRRDGQDHAQEQELIAGSEEEAASKPSVVDAAPEEPEIAKESSDAPEESQDERSESVSDGSAVEDDVRTKDGESAPATTSFKRGGKHAKVSGKDANKADAASKGAQVDTGQVKARKKERARRIWKRLGIAAAIVVGILGVGYLGGVALFATHFYPNSNISMVDISWDAPDQAAAELDDAVGDLSFRVKGQGMNLTVTSEEMGIDLDSASVADAVLAAQRPWTWPVRVFDEHDVTEAVEDAMSASALSDVIEQAVAGVNATMQAPVNAAVIFKEDVGKFYIQPEQEGTMLDPQKVVEKCMAGVLALKRDIVLKKDDRLDPTVLQDDERVVEACAQANRLAGADITFTLDGAPAANVNATTIGAWVSVTPEYEVLFDSDALNAWAEEVGNQFNTVGSERTYMRPDGKEVTVKGGSYGWKVDSSALASAVVEAVQNGTAAEIEIPVLQSGRGFTAVGAQDWGARYVDVDISEQYARFYDDAGELIWESPIVSGARGSHDSPTGVYVVNHKQSPTVLIGQMTSEGVPEYESKVTYWMPFIGNSVGLHDASWQSAFGGSRYANGFGSHGCINLPSGAAGDLYGMIEPGDVVVVHY